MTIKAAFLADSANETRDGKVNILGIFTVIYAGEVPSHLSACTLVAVLQPELEDIGTTAEIQLNWVDPEHIPLLSESLMVEILDPQVVPLPPANIITHIHGLPVTRFGPHELHLQIKGNGQARSLILIEVRPRVSVTGATP